MIKKFKNGNIVLSIKEELKSGYFEPNIHSVEGFYHNDMFFENLYINQINGYMYIVDFNTQFVYDLPGNNFELFLLELIENGKIKLIPYGKRISKSLIQDLENGY